MSIHKQPVTETIVRQIFELVSTPFRLALFRERWDSFGWRYDPGIRDEFGFRVQVPNSWPLSVDPLGDEVIGASLPFYYWEGYDPEFHKDLEHYRRERNAFDEEFENVALITQQVLSPPILKWTDLDKDAHKAFVWQGGHGLLILQQACFDPQFGIELDFWIVDCPFKDFHPTTPLIDWLCKRSESLHAERDFPPLRF